MKTKFFFGMLLMAFLAVAGLTACSDDDNDNLTSIAGTEWYGSHVVSTYGGNTYGNFRIYIFRRWNKLYC